MITPGELRKCGRCVYLAADKEPAKDISKHFNQAADYIEELEGLVREIVFEIRAYGYSRPRILSLPIIKAIIEGE